MIKSPGFVLRSGKVSRAVADIGMSMIALIFGGSEIEQLAPIGRSTRKPRDRRNKRR